MCAWLGSAAFIADADGENPIAVPSSEMGAIDLSNVFWSPDSARVAFLLMPHSDPPSADLASVLLVSDRAASVATTPTAPAYPAEVFWSPDSQQLVYRENGMLVAADPFGAGVVTLGSERAGGGWSVDGAWFALDTKVVSADGSVQLAISTEPKTNGLDGTWSPTAPLLAFGYFGGLNLWSSTGPKSLNDLRSTGIEWSPDGSKLALVAKDPITSRPGITVVSAGDGKALSHLQSLGGSFQGYAWSSDGGRLWLIEEDGTLALADGAGQNLRVVARGAIDAVWLADQRQILFASASEVAVIRADGTKAAPFWTGKSDDGLEPWLLH
jgi:hypothetical protein